MIKKSLFLILLLSGLIAHAQTNIRWDSIANTTTGTGQMLPMLALPGASVSFYTGCTTLPCSTPATTYISATSATTCPSNAQVVWQLPLSQSCTSTADSQGNFGAYFQPGAYQYVITVSGHAAGPYYFSVGGSGGSGSCPGTGCVLYQPSVTQTVSQPTGTGTAATNLNVNNFEGSRYADQYGTGTNGIATAAGTCGPQFPSGFSGCNLQVSWNYTNADFANGFIPNAFLGSTENVPNPSGSWMADYRNGTFTAYASDPVNPSTRNANAAYYVMTQTQNAGTRNYLDNALELPSTCGLCMQLTAFDGGWDWFPPDGNIPQYVNQDWRYGLQLFQYNFTDGIDFGIYQQMHHTSRGDSLLQWGELTVDGGDMASNSEGTEISDLQAVEESTVYAGTVNGTAAVGATALTVNCTQGCGTEGVGRILIDQQSPTSGTNFTSSGAAASTGGSNNSAQMSPWVADSTQSFPVSTMFQLCYPGSDNDGGGAAGCTAGSQPIGQLPPQRLSYTISAYSISGNVITVTTSTQGLVAGQTTIIWGFGTSTFLNNVTLTVLSSGLTSNQFEATFNHGNASATEAGKGTLSPTGYSPMQSVVLNVVAPYAGEPSGFCDTSNLQSSNPANPCYLPATGSLLIADQLEWETDSYTYNSTAQTVTITNMQYAHKNGMMASHGGMASYAVEDLSSKYVGGGTVGTIDSVFPVIGSVSSTKFYYWTTRTNQGYGLPTLGASIDGGTANGGSLSSGTGGTQTALCFNTTGVSFSASGTTVTFNMVQPSGTSNPYSMYNNLPNVVITTANSTYNGTVTLTWNGGSSFSYTPGGTPSGSAPSTGTVVYSNCGYKVMPAARVMDVYDVSTKSVDNKLTVTPLLTAFTNGDSVREPHFLKMHIGGANFNVTQFQPEEYYGGNTYTFNFSGAMMGPTPGVSFNNNSLATQYLGHGGSYIPPSNTLGVGGLWSQILHMGSTPDQAILSVGSCKLTYGCSSSGSGTAIFWGPALTSQNPVAGWNGNDAFSYYPQANLSGRANGTHGGAFVAESNYAGFPTSFPSNSVTDIYAGYLNAFYNVNAAAVNTTNVTGTQITGINNFPAATCNTGPCTTNYQYYVVGNGLTGGQTLPITVGVVQNGSTLGGATGNSNLICMPYQGGLASYDVLKGNTSTFLGNVSATVPNGSSFGASKNYSCVQDTGQSTSAYLTPTQNTTGGAKFKGPVSAFTLQVTATTVSNLTTNYPCTSTQLGMMAVVTDATSPTFLGTLTGGSTTYTPVTCNGSSWVAY